MKTILHFFAELFNFSHRDKFYKIRLDWQKFYKTNFGWKVDFGKLTIPTLPEKVGDWRLIFIPRGMNTNLSFRVATNHFSFRRDSSDLNGEVIKNTRIPKGNYAIWVRDDVEADQELVGLSTKEADPNMLIGITLLERIILEIKYFKEKGKHLDIKGITLCGGSRNDDGTVPTVYYSDGQCHISRCPFDKALKLSGIRKVYDMPLNKYFYI